MTAIQKLAALKTREHLSFEQWLTALNEAAHTNRMKGVIVRQTGAECWRDFYEDGLTPAEAMAEDLSHE